MPARILVVDDNRANLDLMVYLARAFGHTADPCSDGIAGEQMAKSAAYDLILTDVLMPGIDGYELARRLRADPSTRTIPLVAVSALAMVGDRERILSGGFDGYVAKPIDPETFVAQVDGFLPRELRSQALAAPATTLDAAPASAAAGPLILAVDDVSVNLDVIEGALRPFGYRVVKAASVREALAKIERDRPAMVLSDVHMPDGDGFSLLRQMKEHPELRNVPFVFISTTAWTLADKMLGLELGAAQFLLRPIEPRALLQAVQDTLGAPNRA